MKPGILFFLLLFSFHNSFSQKIRFSDTSNKWYQSFYKFDTQNPVVYDISYSLKEDTLIADYNSNKLTVGVLREDSEKVFLKKTGDSIETLVYDYSMNIGDTFSLKNKNYVHVVSDIDSTIINGIWHRVWEFSGVPMTYSRYYVVEGVGCVNGPLYPLDPWEGQEGGYSLRCFYNNGGKPMANPKVGYYWANDESFCLLDVDGMINNRHSLTVFPNPMNQYANIQFDNEYNKPFVFSIYNMFGQIAFTEERNSGNSITIYRNGLPSGVYYCRLVIANETLQTGKLIIED